MKNGRKKEKERHGDREEKRVWESVIDKREGVFEKRRDWKRERRGERDRFFKEREKEREIERERERKREK
jgi:hypothetical protein